jgi:uncharacterized protein YjbJ (UPF0337 family)
MDGQMDKVKGRVKQAVGDLTHNKRLKAEGKLDEFRGTAKNKIDKAADTLKKQVYSSTACYCCYRCNYTTH